MKYECPVCYYGDLPESPENHIICPCCGTQFDYDDAGHTHAELRESWIRGGMKWWSDYRDQPKGWNPEAQLKARAGK